MEIRTDWANLKSFAEERNLPVQWVDYNGNYYLSAHDGPFSLSTLISQEDSENEDLVDFEDNFKDDGNKTVFTPISRPSDPAIREFVHKYIDHVALTTSATVIHTVTSGKVFYLQNIVLSVINNSTSNGRFNINDEGTIKIPFTLPTKPIGGDDGSFSQAASFQEPLKFTTSVRATEVAGAITASITIVGYEE